MLRSYSAGNRAAPFVLVVFGFLWALWYPGMSQIGWGEPGSTAYQNYETYNRLLPLILIPIAVALLASRSLLPVSSRRMGNRAAGLTSLGLVVMTAGSFLEFWVFSLAPYAPRSLRGIGWITYCAGLLLLFVGTAAIGVGVRRGRGFRLAAVFLILWLPAAALVAGLNSITGLHLPPLSIAVAICGAGFVTLGYELALRNKLATAPNGDLRRTVSEPDQRGVPD